MDNEKRTLKYRRLADALLRRAAEEYPPGSRFPSQRELMAEFGVSFATVERALRELVDRKVLVRYHGRGTFVRDVESPRSPAGRKIALVLSRNVTCNAHAFYAEILFEINDRLLQLGYEFTYFYTDEFSGCRDLTGKFASGSIRGAVLIGRIGEEYTAALAGCGLPFVVVDSKIEMPGICYIVADNAGGARTMVQHLIDRGHRRIAFVSTPLHTTLLDRYIGYCNALAGNGIEVDFLLVQRFFRYEEAERDLAKLLEQRPRPTAIFAANDTMASAVCKVLEKRGLSVPYDISVAGFDGDYIGMQNTPRLATMVIPRRELARAAVKALLLGLRGEPAEPVELPTVFSPGDSVTDAPPESGIS